MQVTIDTRHDTLEEALAVIQLAFAHRKDSGAATGPVKPAGSGRRPKAGRARGGRGSRPSASAPNNVVAAAASDDGSANQTPAGTDVSPAVVDDAGSRRPPATARQGATKKTAASRSATDRPPTKTASAKPAAAKKTAAKKAPVKKAAGKKAPGSKAPTKKAAASGSAMKQAPSSRSAASGNAVGSNAAPPGRAEVVRAWARDQGIQVKAAGRMPAAVITAYNEAHS